VPVVWRRIHAENHAAEILQQALREPIARRIHHCRPAPRPTRGATLRILRRPDEGRGSRYRSLLPLLPSSARGRTAASALAGEASPRWPALRSMRQPDARGHARRHEILPALQAGAAQHALTSSAGSPRHPEPGVALTAFFAGSMPWWCPQTRQSAAPGASSRQQSRRRCR